MPDSVSIFLWGSLFFLLLNGIWFSVLVIKKMSKVKLTQERRVNIGRLMRYNFLYAILLLVIGFLLA